MSHSPVMERGGGSMRGGGGDLCIRSSRTVTEAVVVHLQLTVQNNIMPGAYDLHQTPRG